MLQHNSQWSVVSGQWPVGPAAVGPACRAGLSAACTRRPPNAMRVPPAGRDLATAPPAPCRWTDGWPLPGGRRNPPCSTGRVPVDETIGRPRPLRRLTRSTGTGPAGAGGAAVPAVVAVNHSLRRHRVGGGVPALRKPDKSAVANTSSLAQLTAPPAESVRDASRSLGPARQAGPTGQAGAAPALRSSS